MVFWLKSGGDGDFFFQAFSEVLFLDFKVVVGLEVEPKPGRSTKVPTKPKRGVCTDRPLTVDDLVDSPWDAT